MPLVTKHPNAPGYYSATAPMAAGVEVEIARINLDPVQARRAVVTVRMAGAALTALRLARAAVPGGAEVPIVASSDWATVAGSPDAVVLGVRPATAATTAAGSAFQLDLAGPGEFALYGTAAANATASVEAAMG